ncbi:ATP-grasp domain-containing protein [Acetobacterium woodii]|uniref:Putative ribosomal S6 modification protein n=1 Tax=Acetobacterium woodii (strain ATCC 29683 / DSM 1030 / JCM 2381 / KCTC 1655 / WB1) TaxID=931626 RepID=H6LES1_ACEWD|nr:RimK family alpha-L-glutamate ligase [Acetobacterium woodii]AFA49364.1 putative ribosomal S6 modification protein [Acetobacterium woodii DSM 1030]
MLGWLLVNQKTLEEPSIQTIIKLIEKMEINIKTVDVSEVEVLCEPGESNYCYIDGEPVDIPDFALSAFFGGNNYNSKAVVKMLESLNVLCVNSSESLNNTADKLLTFQKLGAAKQGFLFPKTVLMTAKTKPSFIAREVGLPCVIKVMHGSKGKGVVLVKTEKELENLLDVYAAMSFDDHILIQECIVASKGRDMRIMLSGGKFSTAYIRDNGDNFKSNLSQGGDLQFITPPEAVVEIAEKAAAVLDIYFGSIDFLFGENDSYYICEANSMTGLTYSKDAQSHSASNPLLLTLKDIMTEAQKRKKNKI